LERPDLLHAFQRPRLQLSQRLLERYEGAYTDPDYPEDPDPVIEASRGKLHILVGGQEWPLVFHAETPERFYTEGVDVDLSFRRNEQGRLSLTLSDQRELTEFQRR
jgi:hypothetical protein